MATDRIRLRTGATSTTTGRELIDVAAMLAQEISRLQELFDAMHQQSAQNTDHTTSAEVFGVTDEADVLSPTQAQALYDQLNSVLGNAAPAITQLYAKVKQ